MSVKLSVITINFNNAAGLKKTMDSVFQQHSSEVEYLVIDGNSTDGSVELIASRSDRLAYWVSERDKGIYHAMNKGIGAAKGEYLLFLNSGDFLVNSDSLEYFFKSPLEADVICADIKMNDGTAAWIKQAPDQLHFDFFVTDTLPHQSAIIKRSLFNKAGLYNEQFRFVADWKFYLDAFCKHGATYQHLPVVTTEYDYGGISSLPENAALLHEERRRVLATDYAMFYSDYLELHQSRAALANINNSRLHQLVKGLMQTRLYRLLKK